MVEASITGKIREYASSKEEYLQGIIFLATSHLGLRPHRWWEEEALIGEAMLQYRGSIGTWALIPKHEASSNLLTPSSYQRQHESVGLDLRPNSIISSSPNTKQCLLSPALQLSPNYVLLPLPIPLLGSEIKESLANKNLLKNDLS